jgi:hypothetical protein
VQRRKSIHRSPAKLLRPLAHGGEAHLGDTLFGHARAVVCDLHLKHTRSSVDREADAAGLCVGVARDVGVAVPKTFSGHDGLRELWTSYRDTFGEMRSEFRNVFSHAALDWNTSGDANGNDVSYDGVSLLEIEDGKVSRFRAYFDPRTINEQVVS